MACRVKLSMFLAPQFLATTTIYHPCHVKKNHHKCYKVTQNTTNACLLRYLALDGNGNNILEPV
jgi:hypothetical protein